MKLGFGVPNFGFQNYAFFNNDIRQFASGGLVDQVKIRALILGPHCTPLASTSQSPENGLLISLFVLHYWLQRHGDPWLVLKLVLPMGCHMPIARMAVPRRMWLLRDTLVQIPRQS
jgi:hypothetical protein